MDLSLLQLLQVLMRSHERNQFFLTIFYIDL